MLSCKYEDEDVTQIWNGYCPESRLNGRTVRMKLNASDFFESEETGLQICVLPGVQAIILNFRGKGKFRSTIIYANDVENGEILSPQTTDRPPFNNETIFQGAAEMKSFITSIPR